ncbi:MAG: DUF1566 domain-containing protein [Methylococcaceae bacterium]
MTKQFYKPLILCLLALSPTLIFAQTCQNATIPATTPTAQFIDQGGGVVTDAKSGLMWKKCSEGQVWDASKATCAGEAGGYTWQTTLQNAQAINNNGGFLGLKGWRLPNIKELSSITEKQCTDPAINLTVFPNTSNALYWSSSSYASNGHYAYYINLFLGVGNWSLKSNGHHVRLVRDVQ